MDQYFTKHSKSLQNGLYWSFFSLLLFFFLRVFFFFFKQTYTVWSQGRERSRFIPPPPKFTSVRRKKKKKAIGLVSGFFTKNSWPSPKGPEVCLQQKGGVLWLPHHLLSVSIWWGGGEKKSWTSNPSLTLPPNSIIFPYSKRIHLFFL